MSITMIVDTLWVLFAAVLVFFMNLGFAAVESGLQDQKHSQYTVEELYRICGILPRFYASGLGTDVRRR